MPIRIDRIKVKRGGPLEKDFELEPGDLNLIYGHNETGKTYVVESIINFLFQTSRRAPVDWSLRDWDSAGRVVISGLEDHPVSFTKTGRKLDDFWGEETGLPRDLSRLLVVKAGETALAGEERDGVGRGFLKDYLSGEGLLDKIATRISGTLQDTTVQNRLIEGAQRGELKNRLQSKERLENVNALLKEVEEDYAYGEAYSLKQKKEAIEAELKKLEKAKCYHASQIQEKIQALSQQKDGLPTDEELSELDAEIRLHNSKNTEAETKSATLEELEGTSEDYRWTENALNDYSELIGKQVAFGPKPILIFLGLFFIVGAVVSGFLGLNILLTICGVGSLASIIFYYLGVRNTLARSGERIELENLKTDFSSRFGYELANRAALQSQLDKHKENHIRAGSLREEVNKLNLEINSYESSITETLKAFIGTKRPPQQWRDSIRELRRDIKKLENQIDSLDRELLSLAVPEEKYLKEHPEADWDPGHYATLEQELVEIDETLDDKTSRLDQIKTRIIQEIRSKSSEWEDLITELRDKREEAAQEYREITAEILAKVQVNTVIKEFREEENTRIANGLTRDELTNPLRALTGRYVRIRQDENSGLVLVTDKDEEYPLADISTGAQEQIFLALRMGFASVAMEGQTAFLILDDAFQHSDWDRRNNLITETLSLVNTGWQVFYFAVDDHIKNLFLEAGEPLGDRFKSLELCG